MRFLAISLYLVFLSGSPGQAERLQPVQGEVVSETMVENLNSSSDLLVGAVFVGGEMTDVPPHFRLKVRDGLAGEYICLRARSLDGFYSSTIEYEMPEPAPNAEFFDLIYESLFIDSTHQPPGESLAVAATLGRCDDIPGDLLVGYWNMSEQTPATKMIFALNSVGASRAFVFVGADLSTAAIECSRIEKARTTGFDFLCEIETSEFKGVRESIEIHTRYGTTGNPPRTSTVQVLP